MGTQIIILYVYNQKQFQQKGFSRGYRFLPYYVVQSVFFFVSLMTHVINLYGYLIPFMFISFFLGLEDKRYWKELGFYLGFVLLNLVLNPYSYIVTFIMTRYLMVEGGKVLVFGLNVWIFLLIFIPLLVCFVLFLKKFVDQYTFSADRGVHIINGDRNTAVLIEKKYLFKLIIPMIAFIIPLVLNYSVQGFLKNYMENPIGNQLAAYMNYVIFGIFISLAVIAIQIFREYNILGKINFLYVICVALVIVGLNALGFAYFFSLRFLMLWMPVLYFGVFLYILYISRNRLYRKENRKILALFTVICLFSTISYQMSLGDSMSGPEISFLDTSTSLTSGDGRGNDGIGNNEGGAVENATAEERAGASFRDNIVIGIFHYEHSFIYFANSSHSEYRSDLAFLLRPENQTGTNQTTERKVNYLQALYKQGGGQGPENIFLLLDESYKQMGLIIQ
ncbi:MAG TPA: hypothetical protein VKO42_04610, partial [Patescibacteria group bacterium]|nr:hypothetical protein [Patescibacteria group bacterium]